MPDKIDASCTKKIVCPYCGHEIQDSWECDKEGEIECDNSLCGKLFSYYSESVMYYWSERDCLPNAEEHEWVDKYRLSEGTVRWCTKCDQIDVKRKETDSTPDLFPVDWQEVACPASD